MVLEPGTWSWPFSAFEFHSKGGAIRRSWPKLHFAVIIRCKPAKVLSLLANMNFGSAIDKATNGYRRLGIHWGLQWPVERMESCTCKVLQ